MRKVIRLLLVLVALGVVTGAASASLGGPIEVFGGARYQP